MTIPSELELDSLRRVSRQTAHDVNNLLAVIMSYAEFMAQAAAAEGRADLVFDARQILNAGQRSADLIRRLIVHTHDRHVLGDPNHEPPSST